MENYLTLLITFLIILHAIRQFFANCRIASPDEEKSRYAFCLDISVVFCLICNAFDFADTCDSLPHVVLLALTGMFVLSSSVLDFRQSRYIVLCTMLLEVVLGLWHILVIIGVLPPVNNSIYLPASLAAVSLTVFYFLYGNYLYLKNLKRVMKYGSIWTNITMSVDAVYLLILITMTLFEVAAMFYTDSINPVISMIFTILYTSLYLAIGIRMHNGSVFIFMAEHERKIVESMKIPDIDSRNLDVGSNVLYKNIYDRIVAYFTESKPYLNTNLTINDVVEMVFSNRLYISKAISLYTGRNFCQFVNYYRVIYAIELFRADTGLKVQELALKSGFNSSVSFGTAFKLFMGEKPGDWCRRERYRLDKQKK